MTELPDFAMATPEQIGEWFLASDTSALLSRAEPATGPVVQVDERGEPVMRPVAFRLPTALLEWLAQEAGRDPEGRSGIVRRALQEYRERHAGPPAAVPAPARPGDPRWQVEGCLADRLNPLLVVDDAP